MSLDEARKPDGKHGGWRPKAGRKHKPGAISHRTRATLHGRFPQHVTLRIVDSAQSLARDWLMKIIRACIREAHKPTFRIVEFNVLGNHLHLITEATDRDAMSRGVAGFEVRLVRRLNVALKRKGKLFAHRFHARYLTTPRDVYNTLRYVLLNRKHHAAEKKFSKTWIDPYSSAPWFNGWATAIRIDTDWKRELVKTESPTAKPTTWLLATGWRRHGLLRFEDAPA